MKKLNFPKLLASLLITQLTGFIGAFFTMPSIKTWYAGLNKPSFNPPNWLFGPVWTILFLLMGISLYLILVKDLKNKVSKKALIYFFIQLTLNLFWSIIFFSLHLPFLAFMEIIILWFSILLTIINFFKISKTASYLLIPYLLWVSFAAFLNFSIASLNNFR